MKKPDSILITGASSGIGRALALHYAARGVFLALSGRDAMRLEETALLCRRRGSAVDSKLIDVTDRQAMQDWIGLVDREHPLALVIANAGISGGTGGGGEGEEQVRAIFDINVTGTFNTVLPSLELMMQRKTGQIALVSSLAGFTGWPGAPAYSASKGAVRLYGEALRGSLRGSAIRVSVICPGFVESRMTAVNRYKMPFMMSAEKAAAIIASGLSKDKGCIAFPWPTLMLARLIALLPLGLCHALLTKLPRKSAIDRLKLN